MGKNSEPDQPDAAETAAAQAKYEKEAAVAQQHINMVNQVTPQGSLTYSQRGDASDGTPQYTATQTYSPEQQQLYDQTTGAGIKFGQTANNQLDQISGALSSPLDFGSLGDVPQANEATRQSYAQSIRDRNAPQQQQDYDRIHTQLVNSGNMPGSSGYKAGMDQYQRGVNDFRLATDAAAGGEMANMYGMKMAGRNQNIDEILKQRSTPINEMSAMLSQGQVSNPNYVNTPQAQIAAPDYMGATYQGYDTASKAAAKENEGLYGLLGTGAKLGAAYYTGGASAGSQAAMAGGKKKFTWGLG
tara:strand:- start:2074 stop:2976 length:903 start_codon:yes stop_codon:yes gene_type:complete